MNYLSMCSTFSVISLIQEDIAKALALVEGVWIICFVTNAITVSFGSIQHALWRFCELGTYYRHWNHAMIGPHSPEITGFRFFISYDISTRPQSKPEIVSKQWGRGMLDQDSGKPVRPQEDLQFLHSSPPAPGSKIIVWASTPELDCGLVSTVLFTNESLFCFPSPDDRDRVWRKYGERYSACNFSRRMLFGDGCVMIWGDISFGAQTELVFVDDDTLNAHWYMQTM